MNLNKAQKVVLTVYGIFFIYFSIFHVPFTNRYSSETTYDTLLSKSPHLDVARLVIVILVITVLSGIAFLISANSTLRLGAFSISKKLKVTLLYGLFGILILGGIYYGFSKIRERKSSSENEDTKKYGNSKSSSTDSASTVVNVPSGFKKLPSLNEFEAKKAAACNEEHALKNFKSYMKFYYPDWKVFGTPVVRESSDCIYRVQFTTVDPHIRDEKEVMIAEITYDYNYTHYYFRMVRGTMY